MRGDSVDIADAENFRRPDPFFFTGGLSADALLGLAPLAAALLVLAASVVLAAALVVLAATLVVLGGAVLVVVAVSLLIIAPALTIAFASSGSIDLEVDLDLPEPDLRVDRRLSNPETSSCDDILEGVKLGLGFLISLCKWELVTDRARQS